MGERIDEPVPIVTVNVEEDTLVSSMYRKLRSVNSEFEREKPCTIHRVLKRIRNEDPGAYDPRILAIGPFHQANPELAQMERIKWRFLRDIIRRHPANTLEAYITSVRSNEAETRQCYSEELPNLDSNAFVEMMVLDGCFILEFILKLFISSDRPIPLYTANWNLELTINDMLLLENQIPFSVLQCLFDSSIIPGLDAFFGGEVDSYALTLLAHFFVLIGTGDHVIGPRTVVCPIPEGHVHHLLHLFHASLPPVYNPPGTLANATCSCDWPSVNRVMKKIGRIIAHSFFWVLSLIVNCRRPPRSRVVQRAPRTTPSATELNEAGVKFKKKEGSCFLDVTFRNGIMEIPLLSIQDSTVSWFRNLVAFEQCCRSAGSHFSSYVALMDNLIDTPEDVALLERSGVLESMLGSKEEVARFFNNLGKGTYLNYENHYLAELFKDVRDYCATERHRWRAKMVHDYFNNPWSLVSLIAAIVLLLLTMLQTFFAVYAYMHPP